MALIQTYVRIYAYTCIHIFVDDVPSYLNRLVSVRILNKKLTVKAKAYDSIWDLKVKIEEETGISAYCQQLKLPGELQPLSDNSQILRDNDQLTVYLETKLCGKDCETV